MLQGGRWQSGSFKQSMPGRPLISIVTVTFNAEKHLAQALDSIISQANANWELIVVDGGSTDHTLEIIREREDQIDLWISEPDKGIYDAMNKGLQYAKGDYIGFKNADDWYEPTALQWVSEEIVRSQAEVIYGNSLSLIQEQPPAYSAFFTDHTSIGTSPGIDHRSAFFKADWHKEMPFDLKYELAADLDVFWRFKTAGARFVKIDRFLAGKRFGGASDGTLILKESFQINKKYKGIAFALYQRYKVWVRMQVLNCANSLLKVLLGEKRYLKFKQRKINRT